MKKIFVLLLWGLASNAWGQAVKEAPIVLTRTPAESQTLDAAALQKKIQSDLAGLKQVPVPTEPPPGTNGANVSVDKAPSDFRPPQDIALSATAEAAVRVSEKWLSDTVTPAPGPDGRVLYTYGAGLATVVCAPLRVCTIELQTGEHLVDEPHIGDAVRWHIAPATYGRDKSSTTIVVIKPQEPGLDTNLLLPTDRRIYYVRLVSKPEDYTARGKIVTPLKDRMGSEIRTHYPETLEDGIAITAQEAWEKRDTRVEVPGYMREIVEQIAFSAREDKKVDKRSGVSQRLPISTMELVISNAERRGLINHEEVIVPRVSDIHAALPGITGKLELEYEGELKGADTVVKDLISTAVRKTYDKHFGDIDTQQIEMWFNLGGTVKLDDSLSAGSALAELSEIQGLMEKLSALGLKLSDNSAVLVGGAEFLLEGMVAHRKLSRNEERGFAAQEKAARKQETHKVEIDYEEWERGRRSRRGYN